MVLQVRTLRSMKKYVRRDTFLVDIGPTEECSVIEEANIPQPDPLRSCPIITGSRVRVWGGVRNCVTKTVRGQLDIFSVQQQDNNTVLDMLPICCEYRDTAF